MSKPPSPFLPLAKPTLGVEEERAVAEVLRSGWISQGPRVALFEEELARLLGCRFVRAVNSGTSAITLALKALGVGPGDSVVVPAFTCAATALPALTLGAHVVFADVDMATFNLTWDSVDRVLQGNTKAVVLVHLFGRMADAGGFAAKCRERGIHLVEDACLALGARRGGRAAGSVGAVGCHSFHPRKIITTGEGGAVCTDDGAIAERVERDRNYGAGVSAWERFGKNLGQLEGFSALGFNYKLTDIQAAVGLCQMARLPGFLSARRAIAARYAERLAAVPAVRLPPAPADSAEDVHQAIVCLWAPQEPEVLLGDWAALRGALASRETLRSELGARGIAFSDAAQFLPGLAVFGGSASNQEALARAFPASYLAAKLSFALPIFPGMALDEVDTVCSAVGAAAKAALATQRPGGTA